MPDLRNGKEISAYRAKQPGGKTGLTSEDLDADIKKDPKDAKNPTGSGGKTKKSSGSGTKKTVAQQIATLAALTAEDADAALQKILSEERMAVMYIQPDGTAGKSWTMKRRWKNDESGAVSGAGAEL